MMEHNVDPDQDKRADQARDTKGSRAVHLMPRHLVSGVLVLTLLVISAGSLLTFRNSYASTNGLVAVKATDTPTCGATPATTPTAAPTMGQQPTPTPTPTKKPTPTPTQTPIPSPSPPPSPSPSPSPSSTSTSTSGAVTQKFSYTVQCLSTPTATIAASSTPMQGNTP